MGSSIQDKIKGLPTKRQHHIEKRTAELIQEVHTLQELRNLRRKTQAQIATLLQKRQTEISRFEHRDDFLLSTLSEYIEALGGHLKMVAEFEDSPSIVLYARGLKSQDAKTNIDNK